MVRKGIFIFAVNLLICGLLLVIYAFNARLGQVFSMVIAGIGVGLIFAFAAWLVNHSQLSLWEKRNLLVSLYVILSIALFGLAAGFGGGSIFRIHQMQGWSLYGLVFSGGIFGLLMSFGVLLDQAMSDEKAQRTLLIALVGFAIGLVGYFPTGGFLFVVSVLAARIAASILLNRVFVSKIRDQILPGMALVFLFIVFVLPWTAFLSQ